MAAAADGGVEDTGLYPPPNFAHVCSGVMRSSFPAKKHFPYLSTIRLKTILFLCPEGYPDASLAWMDTHDVTLRQVGVGGNKVPFAEIDPDDMCRAMEILIDVRNHPVLVHCNKGKVIPSLPPL